MAWLQSEIRLTPRRRGFHLITSEVEAAMTGMEEVRVGLLHVFIQHTSASLSINENADPDVPVDLEMAFNRTAREDFRYVPPRGCPVDITDLVKAHRLCGSVTVPTNDRRLCSGTWQGYEHR